MIVMMQGLDAPPMEGFWSTMETIGKGAVKVVTLPYTLPLEVIKMGGSVLPGIISATTHGAAEVVGAIRPGGVQQVGAGAYAAGGEPSSAGTYLPIILGGAAAVGILIFALTRKRRPK